MRRLLERYARWAAGNPWPVVAVTAALLALGVTLGARLSVTADLGVLLPEGAPSVRHLEMAAERLGSTDALYISVESPSAEANHRFVDDVAAVVGRWPERPLIFYRPEIGYFKERRLLFADLEDMEAVRDNLARRLRWEKIHANPAYVTLDDDPPPEIIPPEMREKYEERYRSILGETIGHGADADVGPTPDPRPPTPDYMYLEIEKEAKRPDGSAGGPVVTTTMMIRFPGTAVDMDSTKNVVYRAECLIGTRELSDCLDVDMWPGAEELPAEARTVLRPREYHPEARSEVGGGFRTRVAEAGAILKDVRASAASALIGMMLVVLAAFRSFRALLYVMLPLLFGIVMCLGIAYLLLERLNLITAFTFAVLLGLGIDFGIHLGKRYEEERAGGLGNEDAIARAFRQTGKAILVTMVTTVLAFAALITARFRGFSEFGELCAIGIPLSMLAAFGLFPAVVTLAERVRPLRVRPRRDVPRSVVRIPRAVGRVVLVLAALGTAAAASAAPLVGFEYDYGKLRTKRPVSSRIDTRAATRGYGGSPAVAMAETPRQAEAAHRYIRRRMLAGEHLLRAAFSLYSFVPDQQARKLRTLREIDALMEDPSFGFFEDRLDDEDLDRLDEWRRYLRIGGVEPLSGDFPAWARGLFTELDGSSVGRVLYLMPKVDTSDGFQARRLQDAYQTIRLPDGSKVPVASSGFVFADVIRYIREDGTLATSLAFAVVFAVLFVQTRSLPRTLAMLVPLLAGFAWLFGALAALDINLTFYSVAMLPVILGVGIDSSVHLYSRYVEDGPGSMPRVLLRTGPAVLVSALTTAVSFGSLMATQHRGLFSMGQIAVIGMGAVTLAAFVVLPAMLIAFERRPVGEGEGREPGA